MNLVGNIPVAWSSEDYETLSWYMNEQHEEKFNATVDISTYNIGVSICNEHLPQVFYNVLENFDLDKPVIAVNKLEPGQILPYHKDKFIAYKQRNNVSDTDNIVRIIVFLHNQKAGHQLWINDKICLGDAGAFFGWRKDTVHMAANLGDENRYILQITGVHK
jgi:hypothetical protein